MSHLIPFIPDEKPISVISALSEVCDWGQTFSHVGDYRDRTKTRGEGVKVAILDTGVDATHPDLKDNVVECVDMTGCGLQAGNGHSTHVAGIISGSDNGTGIIGVSPRSSLYSVKILDDSGQCPSDCSWIAAGLEWCIEKGCDIVNMSLGSPCVPPVRLHELCQLAAERGMILVAASGNDGGTSVYYPAKYDEVLAVGAIDKEGHLAPFSNTDPHLIALCPGVDIYSCWPGGTYAKLSGTSMAAPFLSGVIALMLSFHRNGEAHSTPLDNYKDAMSHVRRFQRGKILLPGCGDFGIGLIDMATPDLESDPTVQACEVPKGPTFWEKVKEFLSEAWFGAFDQRY